eukprot:SAG31_NODE_2578_length_5440_cov_1.848717_2_plen_403_part_00
MDPAGWATQLGHTKAPSAQIVQDWQAVLVPSACSCLSVILVPPSSGRSSSDGSSDVGSGDGLFAGTKLFPLPSSVPHGDTENAQDVSQSYMLAATVADALATHGAVPALVALLNTRRGHSESIASTVRTQALTILLKISGVLASHSKQLLLNVQLWELILAVLHAPLPAAAATGELAAVTAATLLLTTLLATFSAKQMELPVAPEAFGISQLIQRIVSCEDTILASATTGLVGQLSDSGCTAATGLDMASSVFRDRSVLRSVQRILQVDIAQYCQQHGSGGAQDIMVLGASTGLFDGPTALLLRAVQETSSLDEATAANRIDSLLDTAVWDVLCLHLQLPRGPFGTVAFSISGALSALRLVYLMLSRDTAKNLPLLTKNDLMPTLAVRIVCTKLFRRTRLPS